MHNPRLFTFAAGHTGNWRITLLNAVIGESLPKTQMLSVVRGGFSSLPNGTVWMLRGVTSNTRYVTRAEKDLLVATQADVGRPEATRAALIPMRKSAAWWDLPQDERRAILEESSGHIRIGMKYLPAIARRLHHCRDLSESEPFDFLTWFDYTPADASAFEDLLGVLRATEEWKYVEREVDLRLTRPF